MTLDVYNRAQFPPLIMLRAAFVVVAAASLSLYWVYFQAALNHWGAQGGILGLQGIPLAVQIPILLTVEGVAALTFWGASVYLLARRPNSKMVLLTAMVGFMMPVRVAFVQVIPLEALPSWYPPSVQAAFLTLFATLSYLVCALFPDGTLRPAWVKWWVLARLPVVVNYAFNIVPLTTGQFVFLDMTMFGALMVGQYQRFQQSRFSLERQQTKWILLGIGFGLAFFFIRRLADAYLLASFPELYLVLYTAARIATLSIPIAVTFALLRYRLYDVDWILNRSAVYGLMSALVVGVLAVGLLIAQALLSQWVSAGNARLMMAVLAALVIAWSYQSMKEQLQRWIDRRLFRLRVSTGTFKTRDEKPKNSWTGAVLDDLVIGEWVARGSMGQVYAATYRGQRVAVKLLPKNDSQDEASTRLLLREMRLFHSLSHPNICQMLGGGLYQDTPYIIMEYIEGRELEQVLTARGVLTLEETRLIVRDVAAALDYLHEREIIHHDVKPRNIILQDLRAVLTDFGTARHISGTQGTGALLLATPDYSAPEVLREGDQATPASDLYSLGVVAYRMLTGQKPFEGTLRQKLVAIVHTPARDPRELNASIPEWTAKAILRALEKDPARRFATAGEFARAL